MFKVDWEKTSLTYQLPEGMAEKMVRLAYPDKKLISSELIAGGCQKINPAGELWFSVLETTGQSRLL